jgi:hypothetical protein
MPVEQKGAGKQFEDILVGVTAVSGATLPAGKVDNEDDSLRRGKLPPVQAVQQAVVQSGVTVKCVRQQAGSDGNPKHRDANTFGTGHAADENVTALK